MQDKVKLLKIITVSILIFIVLLSLTLLTNLIKLTKASARENRLKDELFRLEQLYDDNNQQIQTKQNKEYVVRQAREYLNMKYKDETAYIKRTE